MTALAIYTQPRSQQHYFSKPLNGIIISFRVIWRPIKIIWWVRTTAKWWTVPNMGSQCVLKLILFYYFLRAIRRTLASSSWRVTSLYFSLSRICLPSSTCATKTSWTWPGTSSTTRTWRLPRCHPTTTSPPPPPPPCLRLPWTGSIIWRHRDPTWGWPIKRSTSSTPGPSGPTRDSRPLSASCRRTSISCQAAQSISLMCYSNAWDRG